MIKSDPLTESNGQTQNFEDAEGIVKIVAYLYRGKYTAGWTHFDSERNPTTATEGK